MTDLPIPTQTFEDVLVVPYTDLLDRWRDGHIHRGGPIWPVWETQVAARHRRAGRPVDVRPADPEGALAEAPALAWGGAIVDAFGHQVADFSMRLLATRAARPALPIAFASRPDLGFGRLEAAPSWVSAVLDWLGVPRELVRIVSVPTRVRELFVAAQAEQLGGPGPDAGYLDALDALAHRQLGALERDGRLLYVSRAGMTARFAGEPYLEAALRRAGARILRPETEPLKAQLRAYRAAERMVFAEGSALHALQLLGRLEADVAVLERRAGTQLAADNLRPRLRSLAYEAVTRRLLFGILPSGRQALPTGLAIADAERLIDAFAGHGLDLGAAWDEAAWTAARDADVLYWAEAQATEPGHLGAGSVEHILDGLGEAGLGHLEPAVSARLEPLRERLAVPPAASAQGQPTLLFMHVPRTAGGAVRAALRSALPAGRRREVYAGSPLDVPAFAALPEAERGGLAVVVGDFGFGFHEHIPGPSRYAIMLRHPVSRVLSLYRAAGTPGPSLESWIFEAQRVEADNALVRAISGRPDVPFGSCTDDMLDEAVANIEERFAAVLIRGNMHRSAVLLGRALGVLLPPFPLVNADPAGEGSVDLPKPVRQRVRQLNRLDVALFERYADGF